VLGLSINATYGIRVRAFELGPAETSPRAWHRCKAFSKLELPPGADNVDFGLP
jgi:hypothetical protein